MKNDKWQSLKLELEVFERPTSAWFVPLLSSFSILELFFVKIMIGKKKISIKSDQLILP